jgi:5-methylcytosine-specific restriction endonuclease McrA
VSTRPPKKRQDWMKRADKLFSQYIRNRDGRCRNCGSFERLQCAHIITRSYKSIRVDPENAVALCASCHVLFTHRPLEWREWVEVEFPDRWDALTRKALAYERVDWKAAVAELREMV